MFRSLAFCTLFLGLTHFASAQESPSQASACQKDIASLCPGESEGADRIARCLKGNESKLSPECKAHQVSARASKNKKDSAERKPSDKSRK